jgi:hypothetical protein
MSFLRKLFGRFMPPARAAVAEPAHDRVASILSEMKARRQPCLRLVHGAGPSRLGGDPEMVGDWRATRGGR